MGTAPWLHRAFLGGSLQHLRPGEPQGRLTDRLAGFWSGKSPVLGPSEPFVGTAGAPVRGSSCSIPASSEPRGSRGCRGLLHLWGTGWAPSPQL